MWQKSKNLYHLFVAAAINTIHGFPAKKLKIIGITGTDGKTTTVNLIYHILKTAGKNVSAISTVGAYIGDKNYDVGFHVTNPSSIALQSFLKKIKKIGEGGKENYLVLEVTSHGIDQNRIWGIPFAIAGLTNITHEHLDYHKTYNNYLATKVKLLKRAKVAVINKDDESYEPVKSKLSKFITYGLNKDADVNNSVIQFNSNLPGLYNTYNCLLAIAICREIGISNENIKKGIATFISPNGRGEIIYKKDFTVMIDFAHTPNALEQLLSTLKSNVKGRLIHVFGSAGERDKSKRPLMGKTASKYDDLIILTSEDPRKERVEEINKEIKQGILKGFLTVNPSDASTYVKVFESVDRQDAINSAISMARKGDIVVITGKGHEKSMNYGKGEVKWDEFEAVNQALKKENYE